MPEAIGTSPVNLVLAAARPLTGSPADYDPLLDLVGDARFVLLGEASHGTHEFYRARAEITKRLIREKGFAAVAVEADWPDAYRVNRYVRGESDDDTAEQALGGFERFPTWMWRNADVLDFLGWLRDHNDARDPAARVGFYGLDVYSLFASIAEVLGYLERVDPEAAARARERYDCFMDFAEDSKAYGYAAHYDFVDRCEDDVVAQLVELRRHAAEYARRDGRLAADELFAAEQNARVVLNAERYYRTMYRGRVASWNLRDRHMAETLAALVEHLGRQRGGAPKLVLWAHNSHLGDARATERTESGQLNLGQLVRETYGADAVLVGFTTHAGTVTAASNWGMVPERKRVRESLAGSWERLFHEAADGGAPTFLLTLRADAAAPETRDALREERLERAIGVIYRPETERVSHYLRARLGNQFDAVLHFDVTRALEPLERSAAWETGEPPETFPTGE